MVLYKIPIIMSAFVCAAVTWAEEPPAVGAPSAPVQAVSPTKAFLEFLVEFEGADEEAFELILYHGKKDSEIKELEKIVDEDKTIDEGGNEV